MNLEPGRMLAHYRLAEKIGEGGMGVVWKAEDTTLRRPVALKFLTQESFSREDRRARFLREARLVASLNHPNICTIHEVAEVAPGEDENLQAGGPIRAGTPYLAMEFVAGVTLDQVIRKAGPLPLHEFLRIALQIAGGLAAAHARQIVHRDLKPGNVIVTPDGGAKILDFGLAKPLGESEPDDQGLSKAETLSVELTQDGTVLGTPAYMSPEQARGDPLDSRSDVFSLGVMLYEMVTGERPFRGDNSKGTRQKIIETEPLPVTELRVDLPPELERIIRRCLKKRPQERFNDTRDLVASLDDLQQETSTGSQSRLASASGPEAPASGGAQIMTGRRWAAPWALAGIAAVLLIGVTALWLFKSPSPAGPGNPSRFEIGRIAKPAAPTRDQVRAWKMAQARQSVAISPDGRVVVFLSDGELHLRDLDRWESKPIPGTEGAVNPFFSPDGRWVGFFADESLRKVPLNGGPAITLCSARLTYGANWGDNQTIVFSEGNVLRTVPAAGGTPEDLTRPGNESGIVGYRLPAWLPGGRVVLFAVSQSKFFPDARIEAYSTQSGDQRVLVDNATNPLYIPPGYLIFARDGTLMALPFDPEKLEAKGQAIRVLEGVSHAVYGDDFYNNTGTAQFSVSRTGTLVYIPGNVFPEVPYELVEVDREGNEHPLVSDRGTYALPRFSPDGRRIAFSSLHGRSDIWIYDQQTHAITRQSFGGRECCPVWHSDGDSLIVSSEPTPSQRGIFRLSLEGGGSSEPWTTTRGWHYPSSWNAAGNLLALVETDTAMTDDNILLLSTSPELSTRSFLDSTFNEIWPAISPDGRWLAYGSNETGRYEVYVRPLSGAGKKVQVSANGGKSPAWAASGKELFYRGGENAGIMMAVTIRPGADLDVGNPEPLFDATAFEPGGPIRNYDVHPDGHRFVMLKLPGDKEWNRWLEEFSSGQVRVVLNWTKELESRFAEAK